MAKSPIILDKLFKGRYFEREIIILCVRWYLRFKLRKNRFRQRTSTIIERSCSANEIGLRAVNTRYLMDCQEIDAEPKDKFSNGPELEFSKAFLWGLLYSLSAQSSGIS